MEMIEKQYRNIELEFPTKIRKARQTQRSFFAQYIYQNKRKAYIYPLFLREVAFFYIILFILPIFVCNFAQIQAPDISLSQDKRLMNEKTSLTALLTITRSSKLLSRAGLNESDCRPMVAHIESVPQTSSTAVQLQHAQKARRFLQI